MIVTDLEYALENKLIEKLDLMIDRCHRPKIKKDVVLIIEGGEGEGKSNTSCAVAYYVKSKTNRDIHLFFDLGKMIDFAKNTHDKIIIWDEPALDSLSTDHYKEINKDLIRLLMTVRKKRHFFIFNFTKFYKFSDYIIVDRAIGMIHMYSRKEIEAGRFRYIKKRRLEDLYRYWRSSRQRLYMPLSSFGGVFPEILTNQFNKMGINVDGIKSATIEDYERAKDTAINNIGKKKIGSSSDNSLLELKILKKKIGNLTPPIKSKTLLASLMGINRRTLLEWQSIPIENKDITVHLGVRRYGGSQLIKLVSSKSDDKEEDGDIL